MRTRIHWLQARADDVAVGLLTAMFLAFVLQIVSRYLFNRPLGWTLELCLTMWLWTVFWGSAFCLRNNDHVRFDLLYHAVNEKLRRVFAGICAAAIIVAMAWSLPATWDFVSFLQIKKSATMRIPLFYIFVIYIVFMTASIVMYTLRLYGVFKNQVDRDGLDQDRA
jgi:TRAP-type C4-dicarboxylate transport system permease small subunit